MKSKPLDNGLSRRTTRCLINAGVAIDREAIIGALRIGKLYPYRWPPNYGKSTHAEVCRWVGIDADALPHPSLQIDAGPYPDNGLSYRANRCLSRSGIPATKEAISNALRTGALSPGKRPSNYGRKTHAELCRWTGIDPATLLPEASLNRHGFVVSK